MSKGLIIGAGFSYDLGMPLVENLTKDFFSYFSPKRLESSLRRWSEYNPYGDDLPLEPMAFRIIIELAEKHRRNQDSNYEYFLKEIEETIKTTIDPGYIRSYHYALSEFQEELTRMLYSYHFHNFHIYENCKQFYKELDIFVGDEPLWIITT